MSGVGKMTLAASEIELEAPASVALTREPSESVIELRQVSRWYGDVVAVNDITCSLGPGITGLLGPNGAGKSTLVHLMSGFLAPSSGSVEVLGEPASQNPGVYRHLGLVPERESVHAYLSGYEFVLLNARMQRLRNPAAAARRAIELVGLQDAQHRKVGTYSKGMRQRVKVAGALVHDPRVLLLDEPFNGMDPRQRLQMMQMLRTLAAEGRTILFSSHILEEVQGLASNVLVVVSGRLAASGDFREIRRLMTDRPHTFTLRSSDDRRLAALLVAHPSVTAVELDVTGLMVRVVDFGAFTRLVPRTAHAAGISLRELRPTDESLESVFAYLVQR
jgi:ABC-2 type transport system ATP-binding protein